MIVATAAPSVHTWVGESPMDTATEVVETTVGEVVVETAGVPTMTPGTGGLVEVEDIVDC